MRNFYLNCRSLASNRKGCGCGVAIAIALGLVAVLSLMGKI